MKKIGIITIFFLFCAGYSFSQPKQKPAAKPATSELKKLITGTGLPYKIINDSLAVIPYEGENVATFQVLVQKVSDLYIIYSNLTEASTGKIDDSKYKYLLQRNDHFDIIKVGMSDDNMVYVRADVYRSSTTTVLLKRIITQVANVTNIMAGDLK